MAQESKKDINSYPKPGSEIFADFEDWFLAIFENIKPDIVVAIARGAVRFLQLHEKSLPKNLLFLSHDVLPFLNDNELSGTRVLIFDDSVIFGSTMDRVKKYLEKRGSIVFCSSYVVDRFSFFGERPELAYYEKPSIYIKMPLFWKKKLWPPSIRKHHGALVRSILSTPMHYNLDFPTFSLMLNKFSSKDIPYINSLIERTDLFRLIADVSSPISFHSGISRCSGIISQQDWKLFNAPNILIRPYTKVRFTYVPEQGEIRVTPLIQIAVQASLIYQNVNFKYSDTAEFWERLIPPHDLKDIFYHPSLHRLLTAFTGTLLGADLCSRIVDALSRDYAIENIALVPEDVQLILGNENADCLQDIWNIVKKKPLSVFQKESKNLIINTQEEPKGQELREKMQNALSIKPEMRPCEEEMLIESLGKVFLLMRQATDNDKCREENPAASRMDTGLSYEGIRAFLEDSGRNVPDSDELSLALDTCVDRGFVVPKIIHDEGYWFRAFYFGEGEDDQDALQFKRGFYSGYSNFLKKKGAEPLPPFDIQKLCVSLKDVMSWLPISIGPDRFGYTTTVGHEKLIKWLTVGPSAPCRVIRGGNRRIIILNSDFISPVEPVWDECIKEREFFDAFDYTATALLKMAEDAKLLLSTCRTHRHAFNAVAFEAHTWATFQPQGFGSFILGVLQNLKKSKVDLKRTVNSLYWSIRYITEAMKKHYIFNVGYQRAYGGVKKSFVSQGPGAKRWWQFLNEKNLFDSSVDSEIECRFALLMPIIEQMKNITIFASRVLEDSELLSFDQIEDIFKEHETSLSWKEFGWFMSSNREKATENYNKNLDNVMAPGGSIFRTKLPFGIFRGNVINQEDVFQIFKVIENCFNEIAFAMKEYCKKYKVGEYDFPFSPDNFRRLLDDGSVEERRDNVFLLTLDIIKGTNAEQTNKMKDEIRDVFNAFKSKGLLFEDTGNDAFVACCEDPLVLRDAANAIRICGEGLIIPEHSFGGTRKGLYFGSVAVIRKPNEEILIRDIRTPNIIPPAFTFLDGIDKYVDEDKRNSAFIIEGCETLEHCTDKLRLNTKELVQHEVKSKHFKGPCVFIDLK